MFSFVGKLCSFFVTEMKTLGTQSVSSQPTQPKTTQAGYACLSFFLCMRACVWVCVKKYICATGVVNNQYVNT